MREIQYMSEILLVQQAFIPNSSWKNLRQQEEGINIVNNFNIKLDSNSSPTRFLGPKVINKNIEK